MFVQHADEYTKLNPTHVVPTLIHDGQVLTQSIAIMEYLEETFPQPALLPADPALRAKTRALVQNIASDIQPLQNLRVLQKIGNEGKNEWAVHWISVGLDGACDGRVLDEA
jgi:maleylacetoacetate isomerase